ncbi:hypothetical protein ACFU7X_00975 [Streptomyces chartreusis]|uniref:hypothetical protein n=1 Tax=Streptomyces chartreusis TaxID=1969 RepID=UPI0036750A91
MNDNALLGRARRQSSAWATSRARRRAGAMVAALLCTLSMNLILGPPARADSASGGGDLQVTQTLGKREITVTLRRVTGVPGPLHVDVLTEAGSAPGVLELRLVSTGASTDAAYARTESASTAEVKLGSSPGSYSAVLRVERAGPWELVVDDGDRKAMIPFLVPKQGVSPAEQVVYAGFVAGGVLILVTLVVTVRARRGAWALVPAGGALASMAVAVSTAVLSASIPLPPAPGEQVDPTVDNVAQPYSFLRPMTSNYSRPPASLVVEPRSAKVGKRAELRLSVIDGSTGLAADDLLVHDSALMHLLVVAPNGELQHVHPVRTGRGTYEVGVRLPAAGHYAISAEFARRGGGVQQVRSAVGLDVTGAPDRDRSASAALAVPPGPGTRTVNGVPVHLSVSALQVGRASTLTARVGDTSTLQPWLGMVGHMIVVGPLPKNAAGHGPVGRAAQDAEVWAHAHSMGSMGGDSSSHSGHHADGGGEAGGAGDTGAMSGLMPLSGESAADGTVAAYGPDASFVYTFPLPGEYRVWIQAKRDDTVLTIPYLLNVTGATGGTS